MRAQPGNGFTPPVELRGRFIDLVPLAIAHVDALAHAGADPSIWEFHRLGPRLGREAMAELIGLLLERQRQGTDLAFTMIRKSSGAPIGMSRFLDIDRPNGSVEIGGTWLAREFWKSPYNTETKLLMLGYAFDSESVHRVQLKTDVRNLQSRRAIERLGAVREGVLREHLLLWDGTLRSSVYYSVLRSEWPAVRSTLEGYLERPWSEPARSDGATLPDAP